MYVMAGMQEACIACSGVLLLICKGRVSRRVAESVCSSVITMDDDDDTSEDKMTPRGGRHEWRGGAPEFSRRLMRKKKESASLSLSYFLLFS
jgi:hypothetical protein